MSRDYNCKGYGCRWFDNATEQCYGASTGHLYTCPCIDCSRSTRHLADVHRRNHWNCNDDPNGPNYCVRRKQWYIDIGSKTDFKKDIHDNITATYKGRWIP